MTLPILPNDTFRELVELTGIGPIAPVRVQGAVDLTAIEIGRPIDFSNIVFMHRVRANGALFRSDVRFSKCVFLRGIDLSGACIEGDLGFSDCVFGAKGQRAESIFLLDHAKIGGSVGLAGGRVHGALSARGITIGGDLLLSVVQIEGAEDERDEQIKALIIDHARISGSIVINNRPPNGLKGSFGKQDETETRTRFGGSFYAQLATVEGDITCEKTDITGAMMLRGAKFNDLALRNATVLELNCSGASANMINVTQVTATQGVIFSYANINTLSVEKDSEIGRLDCYKARGNSVGLADTKVIGYLSFVFSSFKMVRFAATCTLGHPKDYWRSEIDFSGAEISSQIDIGQATGVGAILFNGSRCGSLLIGRGKDNGVTCSGIKGVDSVFSSYVVARGLTVISPLHDANEAQDDRNYLRPDGGISFQNCTFENGFALWTSGTVAEADGSARITAYDPQLAQPVSIVGDLNLSDCAITGDLNLSNVRVSAPDSDSPSAQRGRIILDHTTISGALNFLSPVSAAGRSDLPEHVRQRALDLIGRRSSPDEIDHIEQWMSPDTPDYRSLATAVSMVELTATNVDLSGLDVKRNATGLAGEGDGTVDATRARITGTLSIYAEVDREKVTHADALQADGALRLERAEIGELVISAKGFSPEKCAGKVDMQTAWKSGIVLTKASIDHLRVPRLKATEGCRGFPVPLNLSDAQIGTWSFSLAREADAPTGQRERKRYDARFDEFSESDNYLDMLDNDEALNRPLYRAVSRQFYNAGHTEAARRVFIAEAYRAYWEPRGAWEAGTGRLNRFRVVRPILNAPKRNAYVMSNLGKALGAPFHAITILFALPVLAAYYFIDRNAMRDMLAQLASGIAPLFHALSVLLNFLFLFFLRYGVSAWRLFGLIAILFVTSLILVSGNPRNFEAVEAVREVVSDADFEGDAEGGFRCISPASSETARGYLLCDDGRVLGPHPDAWTFADSLWMTARHHVPLVAVMARDDYVPTNDRALWVADNMDPDADWPVAIGFTPDDWFGLMSLLNWVLWPVLLAFLLRQALKTEQQE